MGAQLKGTLVPVPALAPAERETMFRLLERYYENVTRADFLADLAEKHMGNRAPRTRGAASCAASPRRCSCGWSWAAPK